MVVSALNSVTIDQHAVAILIDTQTAYDYNHSSSSNSNNHNAVLVNNNNIRTQHLGGDPICPILFC